MLHIFGSKLCPHPPDLHIDDAGRRVDEQSEDEKEKKNDEKFEKNPLEASPEDVLERFTRAEEPKKRGVRATEKANIDNLLTREN